MFYETAGDWVNAWIEDGSLPALEGDARSRVIKECAGRIEEIFCADVLRQLTPMGKAADFERMMVWDTQYVHKFLNQTVPGYPAFRADILSRAKGIVLEELKGRL